MLPQRLLRHDNGEWFSIAPSRGGYVCSVMQDDRELLHTRVWSDMSDAAKDGWALFEDMLEARADKASRDSEAAELALMTPGEVLAHFAAHDERCA